MFTNLLGQTYCSPNVQAESSTKQNELNQTIENDVDVLLFEYVLQKNLPLTFFLVSQPLK